MHAAQVYKHGLCTLDGAHMGIVHVRTTSGVRMKMRLGGGPTPYLFDPIRDAMFHCATTSTNGIADKLMTLPFPNHLFTKGMLQVHFPLREDNHSTRNKMVGSNVSFIQRS